MFAVGHMALAYILGKASATRLKVNLIVPAILVLAIIPDIDIIFGVEGFHRGPTHSAVVAVIVFIPFFIVYRKKAIPYFLALLSHGLIGDLIVGGNIQLFWPISSKEISFPSWFPYIGITSPVNVALELSLFVLATIVMFRTKDLKVFFRNNKSNLLLLIPIATVLLPTVLAYPLNVPILLVPPHLFYLLLFTFAIFVVLLGFSKKKNNKDTVTS